MNTSRVAGVGLLIGALTLGVGLCVSRAERAAPSSWTPGASARMSGADAQAAQPDSMAMALEQAFVGVSEKIGPAVVSISTEQIEQVQRYFRRHPFFGGGGGGGGQPFDDFFRDFFGFDPNAPSGERGEGTTPQQFKRFGLGSGVIIDEQGLILTNEHVVTEADKITVTLADGREFSGEVKGKDVRSDLAVVKISAKKLPVAALGNSDTMRTGQWVVALGNPFGLAGSGAGSIGPEPTLTAGVVSALHRQLPRPMRSDRNYSDLIQTDAAINPGNSGGPLVNLKGEVIGINVAIISSSRGFEGIGFAIPSNKASAVLDALIEGRKVLYGWLGVQIQDITQDVAEYYKLSDRDGVLVFQVLPEGPAVKTGMKDGDIIKAFNGKPVKNARELVDLVGMTKIGTRVPLDIMREGKKMSLTVEVGERPSQEELAQEDGAAWRGVHVAALTPEATEQFGLGSDVSGVVVTDVDPDSPASDAHLMPGDVINEVNRVRIESMADYRKVTEALQGNALVRTQRGYVVIKAAAP